MERRRGLGYGVLLAGAWMVLSFLVGYVFDLLSGTPVGQDPRARLDQVLRRQARRVDETAVQAGERIDADDVRVVLAAGVRGAFENEPGTVLCITAITTNI